MTEVDAILKYVNICRRANKVNLNIDVLAEEFAVTRGTDRLYTANQLEKISIFLKGFEAKK